MRNKKEILDEVQGEIRRQAALGLDTTQRGMFLMLSVIADVLFDLREQNETIIGLLRASATIESIRSKNFPKP